MDLRNLTPDEWDKLFEKEIEVRGEILSETLSIESTVDNILTEYFSNIPASTEFNKILNEISFSSKLKILNSLKLGLNSEIHENLEKFRKLRNHAAHAKWTVLTKDKILFENKGKFQDLVAMKEELFAIKENIHQILLDKLVEMISTPNWHFTRNKT